tara:strand:- start:170 stop:301 length:132 start_codon:yes stop_codon:yes gene_type:complete
MNTTDSVVLEEAMTAIKEDMLKDISETILSDSNLTEQYLDILE